MSHITRREFVRSAAVAAPLIVSPSIFGSITRAAANDRIGLGFIGTGKRAFEMFGSFLDAPEIHAVAVCDVDTTRREHAKKLVDDKYGNSDCRAFVDYRELLAIKDIDAVVICTPDHWHAIQVIDACAAGKDIYCEKPLTLTLAEGPRMIEAVRKHKRIFQTGSQQRTEYDGKFRTACEDVRSGRIGQVLTVHVGVPTSSIWCDLPEETMEPGLDWDRWLGPAPVRPYNSILSPRGIHTHYPQWRKYREYSGGGLTDMGAHNFDIAQWGLGMDSSGPTEVIPPRDEKQQYGATLLYNGGAGPRIVHGGPDGTTFIGTKGGIYVFRDKLLSIPDSILQEPLKDTDVKLPQAASQIRNWLDCVKSRELPICDVEIGVRSIACAQLCNLGYWNHRRLRWDPNKWEFVGDEEANGWRDYQRRKEYDLPKV